MYDVGRDLATGNMAKSTTNAVENMAFKIRITRPLTCFTLHLPHLFLLVHPLHLNEPIRKRKRKKSNDSDADLVSIMDVGWDRVVGKMKKLGEVLLSVRLSSKLQVVGLPYEQMLRVTIKSVKDTNLLRIWCTLDDSHKDFIKMFMDDL